MRCRKNDIPICIYVIARDGLRGPTCAVHSTGYCAFLLGCLLVGLRLAQADRSRQPMHVMVAMTTAQGKPRADIDEDIDGKVGIVICLGFTGLGC
jgi:hypothetical protein